MNRPHTSPEPRASATRDARSRRDPATGFLTTSSLSPRAAMVEFAILLAAAVVGVGLLLAPGLSPWSPHSDFVAHGLGIKSVLRESLAAGRGLPLWRLDELAGGPGLGNPQALFTFPFHVLFWLLPAVDAVGPTCFLQFLLAGGAGWIAAASLGMARPGRLLTGLALMLSFKLVLATYAGWLPVIPEIALYPLLLAAVWRILERASLGSSLLLALAVALLLHAGHWQLSYYAALFASIFLAERLLAWLRAGDRARAARTLAALVAGALLGLGVSAYLVLPLGAESGLVSRSSGSFDLFLGGHALAPRQLITLLWPELNGTPLDRSYPGGELWEDEAYFGLAPLLLAPVGAWIAWRQRSQRLLVAGFLLSLLLALETPLLRLLFVALPGFRLFRVPARFLFLASFFGVVLAGLGLDALVRRAASRGAKGLAALLAVAPLALVVVEGSIHAHRYLQMRPHGDVLPETAYARFFRDRPGPFRIGPIGRATINYGWAGAMGLELVTGYDPFNYRHYQRFFELLRTGKAAVIDFVWADLDRIKRWDVLDVLNTKYLVSARPLDLPTQVFPLVTQWPDVPIFRFYHGLETATLSLYENRRARERAFLAPSVVVCAREAEMIDAIERADLRETAVVLAQLPPGELASAPAPSDSVRVTESRPGHLALETRTDQRRFVVLSEVWHPGWRLTIDGRESPLHQTDLALLGASVPSGKHVLVATFEPLHWRASLWITGIAALAIVSLAVVSLVRARRPRESRPGSID